ncbi:uncharacterized protein EV420DRAFT_1654351 [Desarmillaria tabescens]|uniref:Uncharacterized protein n=1 Tax=Armillaria tabescens TaxID=1929756 RepID=A0AA39J224_ARMTA|nr:uncharacterized protein EV420DRAFT_1654351 [Desarmillaria tabescens]KAK0433827.1 hypothetical protein EV420DRAFT_1654351 [Desarmillaria tabescens]
MVPQPGYVPGLLDGQLYEQLHKQFGLSESNMEIMVNEYHTATAYAPPPFEDVLYRQPEASVDEPVPGMVLSIPNIPVINSAYNNVEPTTNYIDPTTTYIDPTTTYIDPIYTNDAPASLTYTNTNTNARAYESAGHEERSEGKASETFVAEEGVIVEEVFFDANRTTASGAPAVADARPCVKKTITRDLGTTLIGIISLAASHTSDGAVDMMILMVQAASDHYILWEKECLRDAFMAIKRLAYLALWYPVQDLQIWRVTRSLANGQATYQQTATCISHAQQSLLEATHAVVLTVEPLSGSNRGYYSAVVLAWVLVEWSRRNGVGKRKNNKVAIKNLAYQLVDSTNSSSLTIVLLVAAKEHSLSSFFKDPTLKVHIENHLMDGNVKLAPDHIHRAIAIGMALLGTTNPDC